MNFNVHLNASFVLKILNVFLEKKKRGRTLFCLQTEVYETISMSRLATIF